MSEQYVPKLGQIIAPDDNQAARDCVHVAIAPVIAGCDLHVAQDVDVEDGGASLALVGEGVGIVDPFLHRDVKKGERFYVMLYPGTIEGMRHVWRHKAFAPKAPARREQS